MTSPTYSLATRPLLAGTGTAAQVSGLRIGGKTGTAETGIDGSNTTWFIAFAGADRHTALLGSLQGDALHTLRLPVAGVAPTHWHFGVAA